MNAVEMKMKPGERLEDPSKARDFYSVEFTLDNSSIIYQFKIWRNESGPMFVVVKSSSAILMKLKSGSVFNMTYYSSDTQHPKRQIETRIGNISSEQDGRFEGHCKISLVPVADVNASN